MERLLESLPPLNTSAFGTPPWRRPPPPPSATLPASCDVLIVGAGITGLAAASACARAGRHVVVLERAFGTGATARSGGIVLGETVAGPDSDFDGCEQTLRAWISESGTDCEVFWRGCLELARDPRLPDTPIDWHDAGPVRLSGRVSGGVLDPSKLQAGMASAARAAGATIVDGITAIGATAGAMGVVLSTDEGPLTARCAVMAVDAMGWSRAFDPWCQRVMTVALQTAPLAVGDLEALGLAPHEAFYSVDAPLLWGRVMPDQSLLVGRETCSFPTRGNMRDVRDGLFRAGARLSSRLRAWHPVLSDIHLLEVWTGPIAQAAEGHPTIVADPLVPRLFWAGGYGGHGIAQAFRLGHLAGNRVLSTM